MSTSLKIKVNKKSTALKPWNLTFLADWRVRGDGYFEVIVSCQWLRVKNIWVSQEGFMFTVHHLLMGWQHTIIFLSPPPPPPPPHPKDGKFWAKGIHLKKANKFRPIKYFFRGAGKKMNHSNSGRGGGINNGRGFQWTPYISMHTIIWLFAVLLAWPNVLKRIILTLIFAMNIKKVYIEAKTCIRFKQSTCKEISRCIDCLKPRREFDFVEETAQLVYTEIMITV